MAVVSYRYDDNKLVIELNGVIDTSCAESTENDLRGVIARTMAREFILDFENIQYVASSGLRVILRLRKDYPDLKIINVSSEVYEVFEMTGFTEMLPISKGYRHLSIEGCEAIGHGANGDVYRYDAETIIKVYKNPDSIHEIENERDLARKAFILGIPTAIPYDIVKVGNLYGSVFELLNATSFAKLIVKEPLNSEQVIADSVELLKKIHGTTVKPTDMPSIKEAAMKWSEFLNGVVPDETYRKVHQLFESVPDQYSMLHGDYHFKNIMKQNGENLLIDMDTLCYGHPIFEFAAIYNAYIGYGEYDIYRVDDFLNIPHQVCNHIFYKTLELYLGTTDKELIDSVTQKARLIGLVRALRRLVRHSNANDNINEEVEFYKKIIIDLANKVDTLEF